MLACPYLDKQNMINILGGSQSSPPNTAMNLSNRVYYRTIFPVQFTDFGAAIASQRYLGYYTCNANDMVKIAAAELFVLEKGKDNTEVQLINLFTLTNSVPSDPDCKVNPGLVSKLLQDSGFKSFLFPALSRR